MTEEKRRLPIVCRKLRTKMSFGTMAHAATDWREGESTTAVFWCLKTMESWGPDDAIAHAHGCREGRACFELPDEAIVLAFSRRSGKADRTPGSSGEGAMESWRSWRAGG